MTSIGIYNGISVDPALLIGDGANDPIVVNGVTYPRMIAYMVAMTSKQILKNQSLTSGFGQGINPILADIIEYTAVSASTSITLPSGVILGRTFEIINVGANTLTIFPPTGYQINTIAINTSTTLPTGNVMRFTMIGGSPPRYRTS